MPKKRQPTETKQKGEHSDEISMRNLQDFRERFTPANIKIVINELSVYGLLEKYYLQQFADPVYEDMNPTELQKRMKEYKKSVLDGVFVMFEPKLVQRIKNQENLIYNWGGFLKMQLEGLINDRFREELWIVRSWFDEDANEKAIRRITRIRREIKELEYVAERRSLGTEESKRYDKLRQDLHTMEDILDAPGTGNLSGDVEEYQDPISLATEHYYEVMGFKDSKPQTSLNA